MTTVLTVLAVLPVACRPSDTALDVRPTAEIRGMPAGEATDTLSVAPLGPTLRATAMSGDGSDAEDSEHRLPTGSDGTSRTAGPDTVAAVPYGPTSPSTVTGTVATAMAVQTARALDAMPSPELFRTGQALANAGRTDDAVDAYNRYAEREPAMSDVAAMEIGNSLFESGRYADALAAFTRARDEAGDPTTASLAALRRGNALLRTGANEEAISAYDEAYALAEDDAGRSLALAGHIAALVDAGRLAEAFELRRRLVRELPETTLAGGALARLDEAGEPVPLADRAAVAAGSGDHEKAVALLRQAVDNGEVSPGNGTIALLRSYDALGQHTNAVAAADAYLAEHGTEAAAVDVAWKRAEALSRLGRDTDAVDAYEDLARTWPGSGSAPEALHRRALMVESMDGMRAGAAALDDLRTRYPSYDGALDAFLRSALLHYQLGDLPLAAERWLAVADNGTPEQQSQAWYWLGKAAARGGDTALALGYWRSAADADRDGFYGLRAAEWLGEQLAPPPPGTGDVSADVADWLATWVDGFDRSGWDDLRTGTAQSRGVQRAAALIDLDRRSSAGRTLRRTMAAHGDDLAALSALAIEAANLGVHEVSIAAASRVLGASGSVARRAAPTAVWRLAYPDAYGDFVRAECRRLGVPTDLMFALMRQESRFDPTAKSPAGASGLAQVMPGTGAGIASALGDTAFEVADLLDPETSVRYGVWYLSRQLAQYDNQDWAALAAYNGGPGNAARWIAASGGDRDLFVETIDFRETRRYVKLVEEQRAQYARLYIDRP